MRIVVDTNIVASAFFFGGKPYQLLKLIMEGSVTAVCNKEIVEEYFEIILRLQEKYPEIGKDFRFSEFLSRLDLVSTKSDVKVCRDKDDDKFISCAIDGRCVYIVSGDKDLLDVKKFKGIEILTIAEFLRKYNS